MVSPTLNAISEEKRVEHIRRILSQVSLIKLAIITIINHHHETMNSI